MEVPKFMSFLTLVLLVNSVNTKSLASEDAPSKQQEGQNQPLAAHYQQTSQQNGDVHYPNIQDDNYSYDYQSSSSEEVVPVKNAENVPEESSGEDYNITGGYIPQRRESPQRYWMNQNNPLFQLPGLNMGNVNEGIEGNIERVTHAPATPQPPQPQLEHQPNYNQQQQYYPQEGLENYNFPYQPQHYYYEDTPAPPPQSVLTTSTPPPTSSETPQIFNTIRKKSNVDKLVVEGRRTGDGKIAVVKDRLRARQRRSMMTLSREDENDSEYDDLSSGSVEKTKVGKPKNKGTTTTTTKPTTSKS